MARVLTVIHHVDEETTRRNAEIAIKAGADGLFLIQMSGRDLQLIIPARELRQAYSDKLIGLNFLSFSHDHLFNAAGITGADCVWIDNPGISSTYIEELAAEIRDDHRKAETEFNRKIKLFGSVAFKTQRRDDNPAKAATLAAERGWIPTTSGPATGIAPDEEKLFSMKTALGNHELAVASGITPGNAPLLAKHVDWVLVATGISRDFYNFDPVATKDLVDICHAFS